MNRVFLAFLRGLAPTDARALDTPELRTLVAAAVARGRPVEEDLPFDSSSFATELGLAAQGAPDLSGFLSDVRSADLHLARACASGDSHAIACLERRHFGELQRAFGRVRADLSREDFLQMIRERLYVAEPGRRPRIADYTGRGELRTWLRVTATRALLNVAARRREAPVGDEDLLDALPSVHPDAEIELMKRRHASELRKAFAAAAASLSVRERAIVRHSVLERLSIDAIGRLYGVHRATAARWVHDACDALQERAARELATRLRIDRAELKSLLFMIESRLDVSMRRCLGDPVEPA